MPRAALFTLLTLASIACTEGPTSQQPPSPLAGSGGVSGGGGSKASGGGPLGGASGSAATGAGSGGASGASGTLGTGGRGASAGSPSMGGGSGDAGGTSTGGASTGGMAGTGGASGTASAGSSGDGGGSGAAGADSGPIGVLVFSKTEGYRHESIPVGLAALMGVAGASGWNLTASEDASVFTDEGLAGVDVLVFLSPTGEILNATQEAAFERFIRSGKGYVGIHAASDTEFDWPFYGEMVGAYFREHPETIQQATVVVEDTTHPTTAGIPASWMRTDEWYSFEENPRPNVHVLMTLDESSYAPGTSAMGDDHPIAWWREYEGTRVFYTALGHTSESYDDPLFMAHITHAIDWAAGR